MKNTVIKIAIFFFLCFSIVYAKEMLIEKNIKIEQQKLEKIYKNYINQTYPKKIEIFKKEQEVKENEAWQNIKNSENHKFFKVFINKYPNSKYITKAREKEKFYNQNNIFDKNGLQYKTVKSPYTNKFWLDRNLGASRVCVSSVDTQCFGDYFQWGRDSDGHEKQNSLTAFSRSVFSNPNHKKFIESNEEARGDWIMTQNDNLWQGANGANNPCPNRFKVPNRNELALEVKNILNSQNAFNNFLKLPSNGYRYYAKGTLNYQSVYTYLWSSSTQGKYSWYVHFLDSNTGWKDSKRALGFAVRCIKI